jgi:hypothetical protein
LLRRGKEGGFVRKPLAVFPSGKNRCFAAFSLRAAILAVAKKSEIPGQSPPLHHAAGKEERAAKHPLHFKKLLGDR